MFPLNTQVQYMITILCSYEIPDCLTGGYVINVLNPILNAFTYRSQTKLPYNLPKTGNRGFLIK